MAEVESSEEAQLVKPGRATLEIAYELLFAALATASERGALVPFTLSGCGWKRTRIDPSGLMVKSTLSTVTRRYRVSRRGMLLPRSRRAIDDWGILAAAASSCWV